MGLFITEEAMRCLGCKVPQCRKGCPVETPIPDVIRLFKEGKTQEAGEMLFANNPMTAICAIVCNHEAQCAGHCVLGRNGNPVHFYEIEKFISETYLARMPFPEIRKNGRKVAVIGGGPAGMTAAIVLFNKGYEVTIFDAKSRMGGMAVYGIPDFRLPKSITDRLQDRLIRKGIKFRPNTTIGGSLFIDDLLRDGYSGVFIATGVWRPRKLGIDGETLDNVHFGISYLSNPEAYKLGENVAIIGMGNVAMDVARTVFRHGAVKVSLYARSKRIAASSHELEYAKLDGADFVFGMAVDHLTEEGPVFRVSVFDEDDRVIGYEDEMVQRSADSTIICASQGPKNKLLLTTEGLEANDEGLLVVDEKGMSTHPGVFAAGDVVHGSKTVVHAVRDAKKAAENMAAYIDEHESS